MKTHTSAWAELLDEYQTQQQRLNREARWSVVCAHLYAVAAILAALVAAFNGRPSGWIAGGMFAATSILYAFASHAQRRAAYDYRDRMASVLTNYRENR